MAGKDLNNQEMIAVSASWLDSNANMFVGDDAPLKLLYPRLLNVHNQLVAYDKRVREYIRQERLLTDKITVQNKACDTLIAGVYWSLSAGTFLNSDPEVSKVYEEVRKAILPKGLSVVRSSFRNQAGSAIYVQDQLTPENVEFLQRIIYGDRTLYDGVLDMLGFTKELSDSLVKRSQLNLQNSDSVLRKENSTARSAWIKVADNILKMGVIIDLPPDEISRLRANFDDAEATAIRRRKNRIAAEKKKRQEAKLKNEKTKDTKEKDAPEQKEPAENLKKKGKKVEVEDNEDIDDSSFGDLDGDEDDSFDHFDSYPLDRSSDSDNADDEDIVEF